MAVVLLLVAGLVAWRHLGSGPSRPIPWRDVTARMGTVLWPQAASRSFSTRRQLLRYLAATFPERAPAAPRFDFRTHRLVLVAAGPRSSTGYGIRILSVRARGDTADVLVREITPTLRDHVRPRLTSPYRLIEIPATARHVDVSWQGRP